MWCSFLESKGYTNKWQLLNAKDYGIPQNRERCFMVSWLGEYSYEFPSTQPQKLLLSDILEKNVDEKYYIECDESTISALVEREREREINTIRCGGRGSLDIKHTWDIIVERR